MVDSGGHAFSIRITAIQHKFSDESKIIFGEKRKEVAENEEDTRGRDRARIV